MAAANKSKRAGTRDKMITFDQYMKEYAPKIIPKQFSNRDDPTAASTKMAGKSLDILRSALADK